MLEFLETLRPILLVYNRLSFFIEIGLNLHDGFDGFHRLAEHGKEPALVCLYLLSGEDHLLYKFVGRSHRSASLHAVIETAILSDGILYLGGLILYL